MANSLHIPQKSKVRNSKQEAKKESIDITSARYVHDFTIALSFTNGKTKLFDFLPLFQEHVKGENIKYFAPQSFKKFIVKNGNIYWGRNEDIIFPAYMLADEEQDKYQDEILYII